MRKFSFLLLFLITSTFLIPQAFSATEQCPTSSHVKALFASTNPLPADGMMPYPVGIADPVCEMQYDNLGNVIAGSGQWFVVSKVAISDQGSPTKYVGFVVFADANCSLNSGQAITQAQTIVANMGSTTKTSIDYTNFFMGEDSNGVKYYFDICLFEGDFDVPTGTSGTSPSNFDTLPIVMADMSPQTFALTTHEIRQQMKHLANL